VDNRCLVAHFRGVVNSVYLARRLTCPQPAGARLVRTTADTHSALGFLYGVAVDFDRRTAALIRASANL
jgi:hypothetical protein